MNGDSALTLGALCPTLVENLKELFGQDEYSKSISDFVESRAKRSLKDSRRILIAGMSEALGLEEAYQVLRLGKRQDDPTTRLLVDDVILKPGPSVILFAPPGHGKSITLQHAYMLLAGRRQTLPLLYLLRKQKAMSSCN
jgi:hypothetical protein